MKFRNQSSEHFKKLFYLVLLPILIAILLFIWVNQKTAHATAGAAGFSYSIEYPENQLDQNIGYYKLKMLPGQKQTLKLLLANPSDHEVTIAISLNGAKTNSNGVIEYGDNKIKTDPSLKYDFSELITAPPTVTLKAGESQEVPLEIAMPETSFDGVIAGGIQLIKTNSDESTERETSGSTVINRYAYVIGVVLKETERELSPELKLNQVYPEQSNGRNTIFVNFSNIVADYLNDMTIETQITAKGSQAVLYESKNTTMRMAPNTFINYPISMNGEEMKAGQYRAHILVKSGENQWEWVEDFEISQQDADKFNERDVGLVREKGINWQIIAALVAGMLVIAILIFALIRFFRKRRRKTKNLQKTKTGKKNG